VRAAEEVVTPDISAPDSEAHLNAARHDVLKGERLLDRGNYTVARLYFERAQSHAEVAEAQARAEKVENEAATATARPTETGERGS
jgi:hypothetical protein